MKRRASITATAGLTAACAFAAGAGPVYAQSDIAALGLAEPVLVGQGLMLGALLLCAALLIGLAAARGRFMAPNAPTAAVFLIAAAFFEATSFGIIAPAGGAGGQFPQLAQSFFIAAVLLHLSMTLASARQAPPIRYVFLAAAAAAATIGVAAAFGVAQAEAAFRIAIASAAMGGLVFVVFDALRGDWAARLIAPGAAALVAGAVLSRAPELLPFSEPLASFAPHVFFTFGAVAIAFASLAETRAAAHGAVNAMMAGGRAGAGAAFFSDAVHSLLDYLGVGVWDWDARKDRLDMSASLLDMLGGDPADHGPDTESDWRARLAPADLARYEVEVLGGEGAEPGAFDVTLGVVGEDGRVRKVRFRGARAIGRDGRLERAAAFVEDVSMHAGAGAGVGEASSPGDPLSLPSCEAFFARAREALARVDEHALHAGQVGVAVFYLRETALISGAFGPTAAETFIRSLILRMREAGRPLEAVTRLNHGCFAALIGTGDDDRDLNEAARAMMAHLESAAVVDGRTLTTQVFIGVAPVRDLARDIEVHLADAELAGQSAACDPAGGACVFSEDMRVEAARRMTLTADLRGALERGEIETHYQPIINLSDGGPAGFEALARWRRHGRELLTPDQFIDIAEETGLIGPIGRHVLAQAARDLGRWRRQTGARDLFASVNISSRQLLRSGLEGAFADAVATEGLPPGVLMLEITESQIMADPDSAAIVLERLKQAGAGLAVDDFGTGFSSLSHLHRFDFDIVKIDRSFVIDMETDATPAKIARAIIDLAHELDMKVIAEGVEHETAAKRLRQMGCEYAQGFVFGGAITAEEAEEFLRLYPVAKPQVEAV